MGDSEANTEIKPLAMNAALRFGQGNTTSMNAVATALNPGVTPPDHTQLNWYAFKYRSGENILCAPNVIGLIDDVTQDQTNPSNAYIAANGPAWWNPLDPNFYQPPRYGRTQPPIFRMPIMRTACGQTDASVLPEGWLIDQWQYGATFSTTTPVDTIGVVNAAPPIVYQSCRYVTSTSISWNIPLDPNTRYQVRFHFANIRNIAPGTLTTQMNIYGSPTMSGLRDIAALAGQFKAYVWETGVFWGTDTFWMRFAPVGAFINAVELFQV